jgi:TonB-linked SusC/RagA family outer membrane protein
MLLKLLCNPFFNKGKNFSKTLLIMKFIAIFLFAAGLQVSATGYSQITLSQNNVSLKKIFREIEKQSAYLFLYKDKLLRNTEDVSINVTGASVEAVLDACLKNEPLSYKMVGKIIVIKAKERIDIAKPAVSILTEAPLRIISGTVRDDKGNPLAGVSVVVKGSNKGTSTDANGSFKIDADAGDVLEFSIVGYKKRSITVGQSNNLSVVMEIEAAVASEVVVVGYGTQKKINLTGAVDVVSGKVLENRPAFALDDLIKGTSPNLGITMGMRGGEPGAVSSWSIRGMGSINGNAVPLILVDGVEMNVKDIDPSTIESISILKDASASAIYGSRAPFGVVLITTKKGTKDGKARIQYSNDLVWDYPFRIPSYVDSYTWATAYNQASANAGIAATYGNEQMERIKGYLDGSFPYEYDPEHPIDNIWAGRRNGNANNDWPRILIADHSFSQKHNINVSGGNNKTQYYVSGGYIDQNGIYRYGYDSYKRYNFLTNISTQVTKWLNISPSIKYAKGETDFPLGETTVGREHQFREMIMFAPMMPFYNINGTIQSPLVRQMQGTGRDKTQKNDFLLSLKTELEPIKDWKTDISYNYNYIGTRNATNPKPIMVELGTGGFGNVGKPATGYTSSFSEFSYQVMNVVSSYEFTLNDHYFKPLLGYEQEDQYLSGLSATSTDLITEAIPSISTALGAKTVDDNISHWATQGIFGRLNYNYKEKYLLELSARYNGSSRFPKGSRWGFFPSASVGYNLSSEGFWETIKPYVNMFKLRASYGSLGNQNVTNYLYLPTIPVTNELLWIIDDARPAYASAPKLISDKLTWETITTLNMGLDASFLNNRLQLTFDWYNRKTTDMVGPSLTLPYPLGASTPQTNNATMKTNGFELSLSWQDHITNNFSYDLKLGIGDNRSTILKYRNDKGLISTWYAGKDAGEIWGFTSDGLIQSQGESMPDQSKYYSKWGPGDMKYKDLDGNGVINDGGNTLDNHGDLTVIGNTTPRYNINFTFGFQWKNLDFNMFWQGTGKRDFYPDNASTLFWGMTTGFGSSGLYKESPALDYWRPADETNILGPNTDAYFARPYFTAETNKNRLTQSKYVLNAAYFRLKSLQIGYTLPDRLLNHLFLDRVRIYFSGENLLLLSKLPKIYDPETAFASQPSFGGYLTSGVIYPISRAVSFGVNLTF